MAEKKLIYMHESSGKVKFVDPAKPKKLSSKWILIQFVPNEKGERVMRFAFKKFTIDVQPNGERKVTKKDVNRDTK